MTAELPLRAVAAYDVSTLAQSFKQPPQKVCEHSRRTPASGSKQTAQTSNESAGTLSASSFLPPAPELEAGEMTDDVPPPSSGKALCCLSRLNSGGGGRGGCGMGGGGGRPPPCILLLAAAPLKLGGGGSGNWKP